MDNIEMNLENIPGILSIKSQDLKDLQVDIYKQKEKFVGEHEEVQDCQIQSSVANFMIGKDGRKFELESTDYQVEYGFTELEKKKVQTFDMSFKFQDPLFTSEGILTMESTEYRDGHFTEVFSFNIKCTGEVVNIADFS